LYFSVVPDTKLCLSPYIPAKLRVTPGLVLKGHLLLQGWYLKAVNGILMTDWFMSHGRDTLPSHYHCVW